MKITRTYMQLVQLTNKKFSKIAPAACHVDNTARSQIVTKDFNVEFHDLIKKYNCIKYCFNR